MCGPNWKARYKDPGYKLSKVCEEAIKVAFSEDSQFGFLVSMHRSVRHVLC